MKTKMAVVAVMALCLGLHSRQAIAEAPPPGNPFGAPNQPAQPGSEFPEEEDFPEANNNFGNGFQPPPNVAPNPSQPQKTVQQSVTPTPSVPSQRPTPPVARIPLPNSSAKAAPKEKTAPKLEDYLELDSSVKGLEVKNFDLPDREIKDVVTLISKWTGKNFILDSKVRGKITIIGPSQVTLQEAYQAFLSALDANGLTTVQAGKFIRIIESAEARRAPVKTYAGDYAPKDDQFITRIFQLKFINSDEVQREFRDLTTRQGKLFAYEPTNSIIITDTGSNIQRIKEILETLDVKSFETTLHVMHIKNGSAKTISDMLGEIYGGDKGRPGQPRSFQKSALERTRGGGVISKIIPDEQTNSLVVLANTAGFVQLEQLVAKLDVKVTDTGKIHVYYCEYAKAEDLASTLAALAGGGKGGTSGTKRPTSTPSSTGSTPSSTGLGSSGPVTADLDGIKITSDAATNALVITAAAVDYQTLKRVIKKLDIPRLQVFIETAIMEVTYDDKLNVGTNIGVGAPGRGFAGGFIGDPTALSGLLSGGLPGPGATIPIFAGPNYQVNIPNPTTPGGAPIPINISSIMGIISLLAATTNTSILSTPQIIALDNEQAEFQVLDEIPVQTTLTTAAVGTGTATGTVDRLKTGIVIKLTPHINASSRNVRLEIQQKVDSTKSNNEVPIALANVQKATTSRVTNTTVVVHDQDYVMLGGLMSDKTSDVITKVPLLGDIPILGWLFKNKTTTVNKSNLVVLMHPKIIGTTLESALVVKENLGKRDKFIEKYNHGDEPTPDYVNELKQGLKDQDVRGQSERIFDYRNNNDDELIDKEAKKPAPQSQLIPPEQPLLPPAGSTTPSDRVLDPGTAPNPPPDAPLLAPPTEGNGK